MASIPAVYDGDIQQAEAVFKGAVSEYTVNRVGANLNFVYNNHIFSHVWKINGPAGSFSGKTGVDGIFTLPYNAQIVDVIIYIETNGSGGLTQFDVKYSSGNGVPFASILSTLPIIYFNAGDNITVGVGDAVAGATAPVLISNPYPVSYKGRLKMDVLSVAGGFPENCGIEIFYRVV